MPWWLGSAHNLKVTGSNLVPATTFIMTHSPSRSKHCYGPCGAGRRATKPAGLWAGRPSALARHWQLLAMLQIT
jgi:hypothetical protein